MDDIVIGNLPAQRIGFPRSFEQPGELRHTPMICLHQVLGRGMVACDRLEEIAVRDHPIQQMCDESDECLPGVRFGI